MGFFETIANYFSRIWDYISGIFQMLFSAITMVISGLSGMQVIITYMPAVVGAGAIVAISILVVRFLCLK